MQGIRDVLGLAKGEALPVVCDRTPVQMEPPSPPTRSSSARERPRSSPSRRASADCLRLGYQHRPDIFARHIILPEILYERTIEIDERFLADGGIDRPLDEARTRSDLEAAFDAGYRPSPSSSCTATPPPDHEARVAAIAREIGFTQISVSHEVLAAHEDRGTPATPPWSTPILSPILRR